MKLAIEFIEDPGGTFHRMATLHCTKKELDKHLKDLEKAEVTYLLHDYDKKADDDIDHVLLTVLGDFLVELEK